MRRSRGDRRPRRASRRPGRGPAGTLARAATLACLLEVSAEKAGNVTPRHRFADAGFEDFVLSGLALGPAIGRAAPGRVGRAVYQAVEATRRVTGTNTNLGIALLLAPLAAAWRASGAGSLRRRLAGVLRTLTVGDARWAYRAIRLARAGGLGRTPVADVRDVPAITLRAAMRLAARRDAIAAEYAGNFGVTFGVAAPALRRAARRGLSTLEAIAQAHLEVLGHQPDTLILRKAGPAAAAAVRARARRVLRAGGLHTARGRAAARRFDRHLRRGGHRLNPGASADLVTAALFVRLLEDRADTLRIPSSSARAAPQRVRHPPRRGARLRRDRTALRPVGTARVSARSRYRHAERLGAGAVHDERARADTDHAGRSPRPRTTPRVQG